MTSSSEQPPKEYIITKEEMKEYSRLKAEDGTGSFTLLSTVDALAKKYEEEFRSRPALAPAQDNEILKELEWTKEHESILMQRIIKLQEEARKAREDAIKPFEDYANSLNEIECCVIQMKLRDIITSLRRHPQHSEQVSER